MLGCATTVLTVWSVVALGPETIGQWNTFSNGQHMAWKHLLRKCFLLREDLGECFFSFLSIMGFKRLTFVKANINFVLADSSLFCY